MMLYELMKLCVEIPYETAGKAASYALRRLDSTLYIFFQCSNGATDWRNNLDFPAKPYKRELSETWYVHRGFLRVWKELEDIVAKTIGDRSIRFVRIAGYSHGGALALLCHEYVWFHRPDLREGTRLLGYGFGAPRVYWGRKKAAILPRFENFTVVRNIDDPVTHLPPAVFGFRHVGKLLLIGKKGKYRGFEAHYAQNILAELKGLQAIPVSLRNTSANSKTRRSFFSCSSE